MEFLKWIFFLGILFFSDALSVFPGNSLQQSKLKPQRRNSKMTKGFGDPRRPLKDFDKLDKFLRTGLPHNDTNDIPDEMNIKIINGRDAEPGDFPWMVALHRSNRFICSAFLVSPIHVVTAAHCVEFEEGIEPAKNFYGVLGTVYRLEDEERRVEFSHIVTHPDYIKGDNEGDIALMTMTEPVEISEWVQPICLPLQGRDFEMEYVQSMGWGVTSNDNDGAAEVLQTTELGAQPRSLCRLFFAFMLISITDRHICAAANTETGVCFGDSGGPLVMEDIQTGRALAIGVASFVTFLGCGRPLVPGVYTATAAFSDWVRENAGTDSGICFV